MKRLRDRRGRGTEKNMAAVQKKARIRKSSLQKRWMRSNVLVLAVLVVVLVVAYSMANAGYYYSSVQIGLETKARTATDFFSNYMTRTYAEYYQSAYRYTETFEDRDSVELQFIDSTGRVQISTYGLTGGSRPGTQDIQDAIETKQISVWHGRSPQTGEKIMAVSSPMVYSTGRVVGVMRYVTSLRLVDRQILVDTLAVLGLGLVIVLVTMLSNMYFVRSVVDTVHSITGVVKRISDGSYGIQIPKRQTDELGEMVDSINEMSNKIAQAEKVQTEFISSVSHELRTPLTAITGWGETMIDDANLSRDQRRGISIILKEARRLTSMVEELLDFTRIEDGRFTLSIEAVDIGAEVEDAIFTYRELFRQEGISLEYQPYLGELPIIPGDPERLKQVFLNILDNAAKYGREGGRIIVSTDLEPGYVDIVTRDFGPGVPEDELENIKFKFYKGNSKERGSGIGLSVCDEIVKRHDGVLDIRNAEDGGLIVTVKLPVE